MNVLLDFVIGGETEPYAIQPDGYEALRLIFEIAALTGGLRAYVEDALAFAYFLEGKGQSPAAAREIRSLIMTVPAALASVGAARASELRQIGKRCVRDRLKAPHTSR